MPTLQVKPLAVTPQETVASIAPNATLEDEIDTMIRSVQELDPSEPDVILATTMALMARCTEIYVMLVRIEGSNRKAAWFRTQQLQKLMDLLEFQFKGASRLIEVRRQDLDTTR